MTGRPVFTFDGTKYHVGDLKVREVEDLEVSLGCRYVEIAPIGNMRHKLAVMAVLLLRDRTTEAVAEIIGGLSLDDVDELWTVEDDDMPEVYENGVPLVGGRTFDAFVVYFASSAGHNWPPSVTRAQTVRDLEMLVDAEDDTDPDMGGDW